MAYGVVLSSSLEDFSALSDVNLDELRVSPEVQGLVAARGGT